jgi:transposase-like protein
VNEVRLVRPCPHCHGTKHDKGRAFDGRRAYRCKLCGDIWTEGLQGRKQRFSPQRQDFQFADTRCRGLREETEAKP